MKEWEKISLYYHLRGRGLILVYHFSTLFTCLLVIEPAWCWRENWIFPRSRPIEHGRLWK